MSAPMLHCKPWAATAAAGPVRPCLGCCAVCQTAAMAWQKICKQWPFHDTHKLAKGLGNAKQAM